MEDSWDNYEKPENLDKIHVEACDNLPEFRWCGLPSQKVPGQEQARPGCHRQGLQSRQLPPWSSPQEELVARSKCQGESGESDPVDVEGTRSRPEARKRDICTESDREEADKGTADITNNGGDQNTLNFVRVPKYH